MESVALGLFFTHTGAFSNVIGFIHSEALACDHQLCNEPALLPIVRDYQEQSLLT